MTPLSTLVSAAGLTWDFVGFYPYLNPVDASPVNGWGLPGGRYAIGTGRGIDQNDYACPDMSMVNQAMGGDRELVSLAGGPAFLRLWANAAGYSMLGLDAFSAQIDTGTSFNLAAGAEWSSWTRAYWLKFLIQCPDATPDGRNGVFMIPRNNDVPAWPDRNIGVNQSGGFGIYGDGAGQWTYGSFDRTGPWSAREIVALPAHVLTEWNQVDIVMIGERVGQPAEMQFWFNGALQLTRNWLGADLEPPVANEWRWVPVCEAGSVAAINSDIHIGAVECRMGRYDSQGTAV